MTQIALSRLSELCPYQIRDAIEKAELEIENQTLIIRCVHNADRINLHQGIELLIDPIAWLLPQIDMLSLEAPNLRRMPIPVILAMVADEEERSLFLPGTIEAQKILSRRIEMIKLCEAYLSLAEHVVFFLDQDGMILETNASCQTYAVNRDDAIGRPALEVCLSGDRRILHGIQEAYRRGCRYKFSVDRVVLGQPVSFCGTAIPCKGGTNVVAMVPDAMFAKLRDPVFPSAPI